MTLGRETWAEYLGLTDKSYHPIIHISRPRHSGSKKPSKGSNGKRHKQKNTSKSPHEATLSGAVDQKTSPELVRVVRYTTNANRSSRVQCKETPGASARKRSTEKKASDISIARLATSAGGRLPSPKPIQIVRRTTYVYQPEPSRAENGPRPSGHADLIEKRVKELGIHNDKGEPDRPFSVDLKPGEAKNGEGYDTETVNRRPKIRQAESLLVEPSTPQSTHLRHYFDRDRAPHMEPSHGSHAEAFSYRREAFHVEDLHRSRTRSVRLIRVGGEPNSLLSSSSSTQTSPGGTELASRPPSIGVLTAQSNGLQSRPQSLRNDPVASESGRGSRPPSRSVRVFRAPSDTLPSRPRSPRNDPPATKPGRESRPPSRSVRVSRVPSDVLRSRPQSPKYDPPASEPERESRPPSRSVRALRISPDGLRSRPESTTDDRAPSEPERERDSRPHSGSIRSFRISPDELHSRPQFPTVDRAPSEPEQESRPPSRFVRVIRIQPDELHSRPQSPAMSRTASKSDQSGVVIRARPDKTDSHPKSAEAIGMAKNPYGSRLPSRSVRVFDVQPDEFRSRPQSPAINPALSQPDLSANSRAYRVATAKSDGAYSRPSSPQPMQSASQFYGSRLPSGSDRKVRVSQDPIRPRPNSRDFRASPVASREPDEPRQRSSSVRIREIRNEVEDFTGNGDVSPDPRSSIRSLSRLPSPICGGRSGEAEYPRITRRKRTRYHGSESSSDSVSIRKLRSYLHTIAWSKSLLIVPPPQTHGSSHPSDSITHPLHILRLRHQSTNSDPKKTHPSDRHSAPVSPSGRAFGVRYVSPRGPTSRSLSRPYQPGHGDGAPPSMNRYTPPMGNIADGSSRMKYRSNEEWPASRETSPGNNEAKRSGKKNYRPSEDWPESPESSHGNNRIWPENRANSQESNQKWGRSREHLPDRDYPDLGKRVSRSGRKKYRPNEDWPESPESSQGSNREWCENKANSRERNEDWGGGEEHLSDAKGDWRRRRVTSRPNSPRKNTPRSRAVSKSSSKWGGEAATADW